MGRNLSALKAELGGQARSAFQALAGLRLPRSEAAPAPSSPARAGAEAATAVPAPVPAPQRHTTWAFGELPELMEVRRGSQSLVGFPALLDKGTHVEVEVFDEPDVAAAKHRDGLRRAGGPADQGAAQVPGEEHPGPAGHGGGLHAAGQPGGPARADH